MQLRPENFADALAAYSASRSTLKAASDGTGATPSALDDAVKYASNLVTDGPALASSTGCLYSPTGYNGLPALKFNAAHVLQSAALFADKHKRAITIALNVISTNDTSVPVILSTTSGGFYLCEFGGLHDWQYASGLNYQVGASAPGVPETLLFTYDGRTMTAESARDEYRRDAGIGSGASAGIEYSADLGISGDGIALGALSGGNFSTCMVQEVVVIGRALLGADRADLLGTMAELGNVGNCTFVGFIGDSIFDGTNIAVGEDTRVAAANVCEMAYAQAVASGLRLNRIRDSYPGRQANQWLSEYHWSMMPYVYRGLPTRSMAFVEFAHNDLRAQGAATTLFRVQGICRRLIQLGVTPFVVFPLPSTVSGFEALRQSYISLSLAAQSLSRYCAGFVRWDLNPVMGIEAAAASTSLFQDGIHPTAAGNVYLAPDLATVINQFANGSIAETIAGGALSPTESATLDRIDSNAAKITSNGFYVTSRVANSNLIIWQGETWDHDEGTSEPITKGAGETWPTDLTAYTITSTITKTAANTNSGTLSTLVMPCTVTQATGSNQSFYIETGSNTANLAIGEGTRGYDWQVEAYDGTHRATLRAGVASVRKRL